jgi:hypothetical protein
MMQSDPHPVAKYRVIGPLSTLPEFQKAFQRRGDAPSNEVESDVSREESRTSEAILSDASEIHFGARP